MKKEDNANESVTYKTKPQKKIYLAIILIILIAVVAVSVVLVLNNKTKTEENNKSSNDEVVSNKDNKNIEGEGNMENITDNPIVSMKIKDYGTVKIELYPNIAPNTVANFIKLINDGYYNGLTFHRVVEGFVIQGGSKIGSSSDTSDFTIPGEFAANNYNNTLSHKKGVISMARADYTYFGFATEGYNSASTQFFIMLEDNTSLDGSYASFGKVIEGIEIVDKMGQVEVDPQTDKPVNELIIEEVTVDTFGKTYNEPQRLEPFDIESHVNRQYGR